MQRGYLSAMNTVHRIEEVIVIRVDGKTFFLHGAEDLLVADPRYDVNAFITERGVSSVNRNVLHLIDIKENPTIFIIIFALAGLTTIGAYIYVKRRKEREF